MISRCTQLVETNSSWSVIRMCTKFVQKLRSSLRLVSTRALSSFNSFWFGFAITLNYGDEVSRDTD